METAAKLDFTEMQDSLSAASTAAISLIHALDRITTGVKSSYAGSTIGEQWALTWGEMLTLKDSAKMLGISINYLKKLISEDGIQTSPDGRVLTRSAAAWANSKPIKKQRWRV